MITSVYPIELDIVDVDPTSLTVALATAVALTAIRRWLGQYEARTKADVRLLVEEHRRRSEELDRRENALVARERTMTRREQVQASRVTGLAQDLEAARAELASMTRAHESVSGAYAEVRGDYNALIEHVLRAGHERFTSRTDGMHGPPAPAEPRRGGEHRRGPALPPVAQLRPREAHPSA